MVIKKRCPQCKQFKPLSEFSKDRNRKDGLNSWCKYCLKAHQQSEKGKAAHRKALVKYNKTPKGKAVMKRFYVRNPNYRKATLAVSGAIRAGRLPRPDTLQCHYCFRDAQQYHHYLGYEPEHWLDVVPACVDCHTKEHKEIA